MAAAAAGIIAVVNAHMVRILRVVSVSRGLDPRDFSLVAFGGAGPLHAADLAAELQIPRVIVPEAPGLFSALGLLWADRRADFGATARRLVDNANRAAIAQQLDMLESQASAWLDREAVPPGRRRLVRSADMRYPLQNYELNVYFLETGSVAHCPIYERDLLLAGNRIAGPAVVEQADSTIVIPPSFAAQVDGRARLIITRTAAKRAAPRLGKSTPRRR